MAEWTESFTEHVKEVLADAQKKHMSAIVNTSTNDTGEVSYVITLTPHPLSDESKAKVVELTQSIGLTNMREIKPPREGALTLVDGRQLMIVGLDENKSYFTIPISGAIINGVHHKVGLMEGQIYDTYYSLVSRNLNHYSIQPYELYPQVPERGEEIRTKFTLDEKGAILIFDSITEPMTRADTKTFKTIGAGLLRKLENGWHVEVKIPNTKAFNYLLIDMVEDQSILVEGDVVAFIIPSEGLPYLCSKTSPYKRL